MPLKFKIRSPSPKAVPADFKDTHQYSKSWRSFPNDKRVMSTKLWSLIKEKNNCSMVPDMTYDKTRINSPIKPPNKSNLHSYNKDSDRNLHNPIDETNDQKLLTNTGKTFRIDFNSKQNKVYRLVYKYCMDDVLKLNKEIKGVWDLETDVKFIITIDNKNTKDNSNVNFSYSRTKIIQLMVKAFIECKYYNLRDHKKLTQALIKDIEDLLKKCDGQSVTIIQKQKENIFFELTELYKLNRKKHSNSKNISINVKREDKNEIHDNSGTCIIYDKSQIWVLKNIIQYDYKHRFLKCNKAYLDNSKQLLSKFRIKNTEGISKEFDNPLAAIKKIMLKNYIQIKKSESSLNIDGLENKKIAQLSSSNMSRRPNHLKNLTTSNEEIENIVNFKSKVSYAKRPSLRRNSQHGSNSNSKLYFIDECDRNNLLLYKPSNTAKIDRVLDFVKKNSLSNTNFSKFKEFIDNAKKKKAHTNFRHHQKPDENPSNVDIDKNILAENVKNLEKIIN